MDFWNNAPRSRDSKRWRAELTRSSERRDMTPRVRWRVPRGRTARSRFGDTILSLLEDSGLLVLNFSVDSASRLKFCKEALRCGIVVLVINGMHRKCVRRGGDVFGGMISNGVAEIRSRLSDLHKVGKKAATSAS